MNDKRFYSIGGDKGRIISFRRRIHSRLSSHPGPIKDLADYEHDGDEPDDYRHRMIVNLFAFILVVGLIAFGLWLATTMAELRKNQDCVLSGRRGCTTVEIDGGRR